MNLDSSLGSKSSPSVDVSNYAGIDFAQARLKCTNGMTCDGYEARYGKTRVFVKRLKPDRGSAVIREAFAKELEIGLELRHRSLPGYLFAGEDYIDALCRGQHTHRHDMGG